MGQPQGKWQLGAVTPITSWSSTTPLPVPPWPEPTSPWRDRREGAVGRCRVDLPIDAPLPDDLDERGWTVIDRFRDRNRWVDVVVLEGDTLPMHVAGEYMAEWRSFDDLREAVARALAAAICPPAPEDEAWLLGAGGASTGLAWIGTTTSGTTSTTTTGNMQYLVPQSLNYPTFKQ